MTQDLLYMSHNTLAGAYIRSWRFYAVPVHKAQPPTQMMATY